MRCHVLAFLVVGVLFCTPLVDAAEPSPAGTLPTDAAGRPLNLDFEKGTLDDWTATGNAFERQPIKGDTVRPRRADMASRHSGQYWIGGYEIHGDRATGMLTSKPFKVARPFASFRVAGGPHAQTRVELVLSPGDKVIYTHSGDESENLKPVVVDLSQRVGQQIYVRLVDEHTGHWGHLNFDDFRLHSSRPTFAEPLAPEPAPPLDEYPFSGLTPEEAARQMRVPEGFKVVLSAGEPDVQQPIAMALDDRGRLWVAEAYTYPIRAKEGAGKDRILIFEDGDGDGRFEKRKVFIEKLNLVSGIEVGFGGVWVGAAPYLYFIPDKNGDDVPDGPPQPLLDGWAWQDTHETLNTFIWGPDGWLYGCHGVFTHSNVGKPGAADGQRKRINAGIWRYHPTRHQFEVFAEGTSNPWGVDFNDYGQAFCTACVIPHLYHVIQGARYQRQAGEHFNPYTYDDIQTIAKHRHYLGPNPHGGNNRSDAAGGGHAHAGAMIYLGGSWPEKYRNQIFMNNIHGQRLNQDQLARRGSGYEGDRAPDFCFARDRWSQILNLRYGPDGQAYMIDWYDANACHHGNPEGHDRSNGRIFKIVYQNAKPAQVDLARLSDDQLVELQLHENDWYVRHARRLLQERGARPGAHAGLEKIAFGHADPTRRLRGLWALHASGGLQEPGVLKALADENEYVRGWAIQLGVENLGPTLPAALAQKLVELAQADPSPVVRLYLASAAQRVAGELRWALAGPLVKHAEDAADHNLPLMYWYALEPLVGQDRARGLGVAAQSGVPVVWAFAVRRVASEGTPEALELLAQQLARLDGPEAQRVLLREMNTALKGRRQVAMPKGWASVSSQLLASRDGEVRSQATALALTFGDPAALASMRATLVDAQADPALRRQALESLLGAKDRELAPTLHALLAAPELRSAALRGLAAYDHPDTPAVVLKRYASLGLEEKRDALNTLAARAVYAKALLQAVGEKKVAAADLSADLVRNLRNFNDPAINEQIAAVWGNVRDVERNAAQEIERYLKMLRAKPAAPLDLAHGRALFAKTCQQCHTLFGVGGKVGPELTGSNRADLVYLLSNVLDPSAVMAKEYQPTVIATEDGRVITGIVRQQTEAALSVQTANEVVVVPRDEIAQQKLSPLSMMPNDILQPFSEQDVRDLVAYLGSPSQTPLLATGDTLKGFFNGQDLAGWQGDPKLWSVESGEIVGRTAGLDHNEFLKSELLLGDFRLKLEVKLVDNQGNSGVQFRSEPVGEHEMKGYQADVGVGWWGKLYEENGRGLIWDRSGEPHVKPGQWNSYQIEAVGNRVRTWINGQLCVDLDDPPGAKRGLVGLQLHSGGATEVRYRKFDVELLGSAAAKSAEAR